MTKLISDVSISALFFACFFICHLVALTPSVSHCEDRVSDIETINIVTTTSMITDVVSQVAGNEATVVGLIGEGVDPHLFKLTRSDVAKLIRADVVFYNGHFLEGKMVDGISRLSQAGKATIALAEHIDQSYLISPKGFSGHVDPHIWMDPVSWNRVVDEIRIKLKEIYPSKREIFDKNANELQLKIRNLDEYARNVISTIPRDSMLLVTGHDAFNYFANRYGFEVLSVQGLNTESETSIKGIERIVDILVNRKIRAVFVESTISPRNIEAIIEGSAARGHMVRIGGKLFSDAMGKRGTYEGTYLGMLDHNITTIVLALGGKAPSGGMLNMLTVSND